MAALGICGGSGYTINAAKSDKRFESVATISMFNRPHRRGAPTGSGAVRRNGMQDTAVDAIQDKVRQASEARALEAAGGGGHDSGDADTRYMSDAALPLATGTDDKELFLLDGAQHIQTYWVDQYIDAAVAKLAEFFGRTV